jgi:hypothetical protein
MTELVTGGLEGGIHKAAGEFPPRRVTTPEALVQHHPGARRATPPHLRRGAQQELPS